MKGLETKTLLRPIPFTCKPWTLSQTIARYNHPSAHLHEISWGHVDRWLSPKKQFTHHNTTKTSDNVLIALPPISFDHLPHFFQFMRAVTEYCSQKISANTQKFDQNHQNRGGPSGGKRPHKKHTPHTKSYTTTLPFILPTSRHLALTSTLSTSPKINLQTSLTSIPSEQERKREEEREVFFKVSTTTNSQKFGYSWYNINMSIQVGFYTLTILFPISIYI